MWLLFDTNIILDIALKREPFYKDSASVFKKALATKITDFEDAIQSVASDYNGIDFIVTRNTKDYKDSKVKALSPDEFLKLT